MDTPTYIEYLDYLGIAEPFGEKSENSTRSSFTF